jgi:hypothetical protein
MGKEENEVWNMLLGQIPNEILRRIDSWQLQVLAEYIVRRWKTSKLLLSEPDNLGLHRVDLSYAQHISRLSSQFGLSPVDRQRLKYEPIEEDDADAWANE